MNECTFTFVNYYDDNENGNLNYNNNLCEKSKMYSKPKKIQKTVYTWTVSPNNDTAEKVIVIPPLILTQAKKTIMGISA